LDLFPLRYGNQQRLYQIIPYLDTEEPFSDKVLCKSDSIQLLM